MIKQPKVNYINCTGNYIAEIDPEDNLIELSIYKNNSTSYNVGVSFQRFINNIESIDDRILDLIDIASYVYSGDRAVYRGDTDSLFNSSWPRMLIFNIAVRDIEFWSNPTIIKKLSDLLTFMTGDRKIDFVFSKLLKPFKQVSIFDDNYMHIGEPENTDIILFSGGLDSLAGALDILNNTNHKLYLVSHQSNNGVTKTQKAIVNALRCKYPDRIVHYAYQCRYHKVSCEEETQRTRMFLYSSIAFAICYAYKKNEFYIHENGITSLNLPRQYDLMNSRASRTTHPKTVKLLEDFFNEFGHNISIKQPYIWKTKADILKILIISNNMNLISSAVSCSHTRSKYPGTTHCGGCSQCVDRRIGVFASDMDEYDPAAIYYFDITCDALNDEIRNRLIGVLQQATFLNKCTLHDFLLKYPTETTDIIEGLIPDQFDNADDALFAVHKLLIHYADNVFNALSKIQYKQWRLSEKMREDTLQYLLKNEIHLQTSSQVIVEEINKVLRIALPLAYNSKKPSREIELNDQVEAIINVAKAKGQAREYPVLLFGLAKIIPDHSIDNLLIESKYVRESTTPAIISEGIAADITKIPSGLPILFIIYDPFRRIRNDDEFINAFEDCRKECYVRVYR